MLKELKETLISRLGFLKGEMPDAEDEEEYLWDPPEYGRSLCSLLKEARSALARANHIPYVPLDCGGPEHCRGTCRTCDVELDYLNEEMQRIPRNERIYPAIGGQPGDGDRR